MIVGAFNLYGQKEEFLKGDTLIVIKAYQPTLVKANKISDNPKIEGDQKVELDLQYKFISKQMPSIYQLDSIKAAKIKGEPLRKLYRGYAKLGFGTNTTPFGEWFYITSDLKNPLGVFMQNIFLLMELIKLIIVILVKIKLI